MASNVTSRQVVDLTLDSDSDVEVVCPPTGAAAAASTPRPPTSHPHKASAPAAQPSATPSTATPSTATTTANMGANTSSPKAYRPVIRPTTGTANTGMDFGRSPKRRKLSASSGLANGHQAAQQAGQVNGWQSTYTPNGAPKAGPVNGWQSAPNGVATQPATATAASSSTSLRAKLNAANGTPSIHYMKSALKSASAIPLLDDIATQAPRPLSMNRKTGGEAVNGLPSPSPPTPQSAAPIVIDSDSGEDGEEMVVEPSTQTIIPDKGTGEVESVAANVNTTDDALQQQRNQETYERLWGLYRKTLAQPGHNRDNLFPTQQSPPPVLAPEPRSTDVAMEVDEDDSMASQLPMSVETHVAPDHGKVNPVPSQQQSPPPILSPNHKSPDVAMEVDGGTGSMTSHLPERLSTPRKARQSLTLPPAPQPAPSPAPRPAPSPAPQSAPSPAPRSAPSPAPRSVPSPASQSVPSPASRSVPSPASQSAPPPAPQSAPSPAPRSAPSPATVSNAPLNNGHTGSYQEKSDHLLIFLKEVKRLMWREITVEFAKDIPGRTYIQLQSHYSSKINKRDRTQDPPTLNLPPRFAAEATIDWATVHANTAGPRSAGPRVHKEVADLSATVVRKRSRPPAVQKARDDDSSGSDSGIRRQRTRRAPPVNYTWPKLRTTEGEYEEWVDEEDVSFGFARNVSGPMRSESPTENTFFFTAATNPAPPRPATDFCSLDAQLGLAMQKGMQDTKQEHMPYLSSRQRSAMRNNPAQWTWERENVEDWQGAALHVDFSPAELQIVEKVIAKSIPSGSQSRHSTYRRHLRVVLKNLSAPKRQMLAYNISRHIRSRNLPSIASFIEDAAAGTISDVPRIQRLAVTKTHSTFSIVQKLPVPVSSITRNRELGLQSRRGWQTATTAVSYQIRNQLIDTLGPKSTWTGASSDIHTVAWSPDGQCFAAGAVAVTDPDSMQYNRPNVLLYGNTISGNIHELGSHSMVREKTSAGPNSTHAMHVTQDPKLYTTVSSVAFAPSGNWMYSAGYDGHVSIWDVTKGSEQPDLVHRLKHTEKVQILAVNPAYDGNIATATTRTTGRSVKLLSFEEDEIPNPGWIPSIANFASSKAVARPDLNISVNALKYDPTGRLLLAGFGANARGDQSFDTSGDICLWDVETEELLKVNGSSRNVFDVTFNPTIRYHGLFAVGCVANGNVNRGTRSVVRFHDLKVTGSDAKYSSRIELECKALDMNDIVWCPYDSNLFAAGCTDGRTYMWDIRRPEKILYTLSHGSSLMPLQDGVPHERTDTGVRFLSWGQNARRLYSGSSDGVVKVWDVAQSQEDVFVKDLITTRSGIMSGAFTTDYSKLLLGEVNGTANVLEVGRDDVDLKDAERLLYRPYVEKDDETGEDTSSDNTAPPAPDSAAIEARTWLETGQLQLAAMGGFPKQQVLQGPNYAGPYDSNDDAHTHRLREEAFRFQQKMIPSRGAQCDLPGCAEIINTTTYEDIGDSGRSRDRIPDELRRQWLDEDPRVVPGRTKCTQCGRPAIPSTTAENTALCENCGFTCFRCGESNVVATDQRLDCCVCGGQWSIGALGYECVQAPTEPSDPNNVPWIDEFDGEMALQRAEEEEEDTSFGDEMNALSDYYFGLAIERAGSPGL